MTKIRKISSTPAKMEKTPKMVKTVVKIVPPIPAAATTVFLLSTSNTSRSLIRPRISSSLSPVSPGRGSPLSQLCMSGWAEDHPQLLGDASTRQIRDQEGRALGQIARCLRPAEEGQEVGHVRSRWAHGRRGGAVRAGLDGDQHVRFPQQGHQLRQSVLVQCQRSQLPGRARRVLHARVGIPGVRDEHIVHPPWHEEQFLGFVQPQHDHRLERTEGTGCSTTARTLKGTGMGPMKMSSTSPGLALSCSAPNLLR